MRQINFRAWDENGNYMDIVGEMSWCVGGIRVYGPGHHIDNGWVREGGNVILMQFTGLCDKSGKRVFEGDVIKGAKGNSGRDTWEVYWNIKELEFSIRPVDNFRDRMHYKLNGIVNPEVIGNIYENPALLKEGA